MSFLAPLFLLGGLAIAAPIVFHLIRRTSRERVPFSSLMFLMPTPPRVTRRSRLEDILLLVLRCAVIALLALGFSRPFLQKQVNADPAGSAAKRVVVLVDTSASMRREGLWNLAKDKAIATARAADPGEQLALIAFDRQARTLVTFDKWSGTSPDEREALFATHLSSVSPAWAGTHLDAALTAAAELLVQADTAEGASKHVVVISDLQEGSRIERLQSYDWPEGIQVRLEPLVPRNRTNAGLQLVSESDDAAAKPGTEESIRVRVSNASDSVREQFRVQFEGGSGSFDVYVPPGQSRIVRLPIAAGAPRPDKIVLTGDDHDFDNAVFVAPSRPDQLKVTFIGSDSESDTAQLLFYVRRALQETRRQVVQVESRRTAGVIDAANVALIIVSDTTEPRAVRDVLARGATVLVVMKSTAAGELLSKVVEREIPVTEASVSRYAMLGEIDFQHPLFAPFADPRFSDFTKVHFWKHRKVDLANLPDARVLARFDSGEPAFFETKVGPGKLLVLASGWHPADSQLALSSKFVPLLYSFVELGRPGYRRELQLSAGTEVSLASPGTQVATSIRKPGAADVTLAAGTQSFGDTAVPGIYEVSQGQSAWKFAVNVDPQETRTAPLVSEELERFGVTMERKETAGQVTADRRRQLQNSELESRQKLWRWLIATTLVVLMLETVIAGLLARRQSWPAEATT